VEWLLETSSERDTRRVSWRFFLGFIAAVLKQSHGSQFLEIFKYSRKSSLVLYMNKNRRFFFEKNKGFENNCDRWWFSDFEFFFQKKFRSPNPAISEHMMVLWFWVFFSKKIQITQIQQFQSGFFFIHQPPTHKSKLIQHPLCMYYISKLNIITKLIYSKNLIN